ncbi:hypothetical protein DPMN_138227 [Dreissena polymorpha]|uniref:C1q domain-containing protein n=1 Tax=Dreissena polymorpha TaxID=45954 RepID=A0A9D4G437_DREPO|nr:hypothetical protein DPMN_138227 [Dreissena polymorpha]
MLKEICETNVKVESALKLMHEDRHKLAASKEEMDTEIKATLHVSLKNMSDSLAFMKHLHAEMGTQLNDVINTSMINISDAVAKMTENSSKTGLQLNKDIDILKEQLTISSIYFHAFNVAEYSFDTSQIVVYTTVRVNEGQCYDLKTGRFTVSVPGLYVFTVHYDVGPSARAYLAIVHQGAKKQESYIHHTSNDYESASMQVFIKVAKSDQIWVQAQQGSNLYSSTTYNSFTGVLIHV